VVTLNRRVHLLLVLMALDLQLLVRVRSTLVLFLAPIAMMEPTVVLTPPSLTVVPLLLARVRLAQTSSLVAVVSPILKSTLKLIQLQTTLLTN